MTFPKWVTTHFAKPQQDILTRSWRWLMGGVPFAEPVSSACWTAFVLWPWGDAWLPDGEHGRLRCSLLTWICCSAGVSLPQTIAIMFMNLNLRVVQRAWPPRFPSFPSWPVFSQCSLLLSAVSCAAWNLYLRSMFSFPWALFLLNISQWKWAIGGGCIMVNVFVYELQQFCQCVSCLGPLFFYCSM